MQQLIYTNINTLVTSTKLEALLSDLCFHGMRWRRAAARGHGSRARLTAPAGRALNSAAQLWHGALVARLLMLQDY